MSHEKTKNGYEKVPLAFREQYFSVLEGPEPETVHPDLFQRLIDDGTDIILDHLKAYNRKRKELKRKARNEIELNNWNATKNLLLFEQ